jgi:predicted O-linked N-acetylglucosamine transferase (SPINDLY family)
MATIPQALAAAIEHHQAGRLQAAEQIYRQILAAQPSQPDALHLLGVIAHQVGNYPAAIAYVGRAIDVQPRVAVYHRNLGLSYRALKRIAEAVACCRRAVELKPDFAEAHYDLAIALQDQSCPAEAVPHYRRALELKADYAEAWYGLGNALRELGHRDEAADCYRQLLKLQPDHAEGCNNLGNIVGDQGQLDEAIALYRRALAVRPDYVLAYTNLGSALHDRGYVAEAIACYREALARKPDDAGALSNLGNALKDQGQLDAAVASFRRAIELQPGFAHAWNNLGNALKDQGLIPEAIAAYRRAVDLDPAFALADSNLVYTHSFLPESDDRTIDGQLRRWNRQHAEPLAQSIRPHDNDRTPDRRLRIGYVSPDFRLHPVAQFLLPLLESHDHQRFEIFLYASMSVHDAISDRCRAQADAWRDVFALSDEQLAGAIRRDEIDVLVDLAMHTAGNRLLTFARKPAPVQATYLAYCGKTGLATIDYRLTDPYLDPPAQNGPQEAASSFEQPIRLPETYWCYRPLGETPPVAALPSVPAGQATFGCLNNFCKATPPALELWSRLLRAMPESRLLLHAHPGSHRDRVRDLLAGQGVAPDRLTFVGMLPRDDYFRLYGQIHVALDPFPYGGGTTTCDALWMGVPVVSLAGRTSVGRGGLSILSSAGFPEFAAADADQYTRIALELAGDLRRLHQLRATMRDRVRRSPLMDGPRFARHVEAAYRTMWQRWSSGPGAE